MLTGLRLRLIQQLNDLPAMGMKISVHALQQSGRHFNKTAALNRENNLFIFFLILFFK